LSNPHEIQSNRIKIAEIIDTKVGKRIRGVDIEILKFKRPHLGFRR